MALDYGNVKDMYDTLKDSGITTKTLPEWSQEMNELTGTDLYAAGLHDNIVKRASHGIDKLLQATGLPSYTEKLGRAVGGVVGAPEAGAEIGRGLPRATVNFAPLLLSAFGPPGAAAGISLTGALTGAETYEKTGSPLAGLISGGTAAALPGVAGAATRAVEQPLARLVGGRLVAGPLADLEGNIVRQAAQYFPETLGQRAIVRGGGELAGQAAAAGVMGVAQPLEQVARGEEPSSPFTVENLLGLTLGQAPFAAIHLARGAIAPGKSPVLRAKELEDAITLSRSRIALKDARKDIENLTGVERLPTIEQRPEDISPETTKETQLLMSQVRKEQLDTKNATDLTDDDKAKRLGELTKRDYELNLERKFEPGTSLMGDQLTPDVPRQEVFGSQLKTNKNGTWRAIHVADDPLNPENLRGKVVTYSTLHEPAPYSERGTGVMRYSLPPDQWRTIKTRDEWDARFRRTDVGTPELPVRSEPITEEELQAQLHDLETVHAQVDAADTPAEVQQAAVKVDEVKQQHDLPPVNDARLSENTKQLEEIGVDPGEATKAAVKSEATRTARQVGANARGQRAAERAVPPLTPEQAAEITAAMEGGFSVITADKLSHAAAEPTVETQPLKDTITEAAIESARSPAATEAFNTWEGRGDTTLTKDFQDFLDLVQNYGSLSRVPLKGAGAMLAERTGAVPWDAAEVQEFINRPHVQEWGRGLDEGLAQRQRQNMAPVPQVVTPAPETRVPQNPIWTPQEQRDVDLMNRMGMAEGGVGLNRFLGASKNPLMQAISRDLSKFGDSLVRVLSNIRDFENGAYTMRRVGKNYEIAFSPAVLRTSDAQREYWVAHELVHGITLAELDNPSNFQIYRGIEDLRNRVGEALPTKMKKAWNDALESNWYDDFTTGRRDFESLMPRGTDTQRDILYALLNPHEFVAQGLSSNDFRNHLLSIKVAKGETFFSRFANMVKTLLGIGDDVSGTAFEEFLSRTDQLLDRGNFVSSFRNFSDRYFENLGQSKQQVASNTQRATALILDDYPVGTPAEALMLMRMGAGAFRTPEWGLAQRDVLKMFQERGEDATSTTNVLNEAGFKPNHEGLLDMADALMLGDEGLDALHVLPEAAARYVFETVKDAQNIFGAIRAATRSENKGILNLANPEFVGNISRETLKGVEKVMAANRLHDMQVRDIQGLFQMVPDAYLDKWVGAPETIPTEFSGEKEPVTRDTVSRFLEPTAQIARRIPESAEAIDRGFQLRANVRHMAREALKVLGMDLNTMNLTKDTVKNMFRVFQNPTIRKAADKWIGLNNIEGGENVKVIDADDPRVQKILSNLSTADRGTVEDMVNKHSISQQHMQNQILEKRQQIASTDGGALIQKLTGFKLKDSVTLAGRLMRAFTANRADPNEAAAADGEIQFVQSKMDADQFLTVARFTKAAADAWLAQKEVFESNKGWSTARRFGKYLVEFKKNGEVMLDAVDSKKEAEALTEGRPYKLKPNRQYDEDRPPSLGFDAPGVANRLRQYEQNMRDILQNSGTFSPDQIEQMKRYSASEQFVTEQAYRGGIPNLEPQARKLGKGAEELPWLRNHVSYVHQTANYWSRQLLRSQARAHLMDPEIAANPQLQNDLRTHFENMLQPDTQVGNFFRRFAMTWFMGANPASAMVNATQPFVTHVGELTAMTGKPLESYRRTISALKEVYASGLGHFEWKDPVTREFMKRFVKDGEADISMFDDTAAGQELLHTNLVRMLNGDRPQTLGQKLSTLSGNMSNASMMLFRTVERINAMAAGISGYKYYREQGLSDADAYTKAVQFHHAVNYGGGAAARPIGAFAGRGAFPRTVAMLSTAMQSYNLGSMFQIARYIRQGYFRPEGLTPGEVHAARTAAVQMLGTQLAAAGVLGLPFVSGMLSVLNQAFPQLELNRKLRENMNALLGGDEDNGSVLNDIAMTGVPSMMGWDLQSRLSMGNTLPGVSEINGFEPENLLGAPVNLVSNFIKGGYKLAAGDVRGVDDFMPSALKKMEQLLRSGGQVLDYRNRPIFTPTVGEKVGIALGFNPKRLSDFNAASRIARQADDNIKRREGQFHQQMAEEVLNGNFGTVRQALQERLRGDAKYDPREAVRSISGAAEELTFPRDLRREGSARGSDVRSQLLASFNIPPAGPSEVDRLRFRQGVAQRLGLVGASPTGLQTATTMDELRRQQPAASRAELRRQATLLLHGRRPQIFPLQAE